MSLSTLFTSSSTLFTTIASRAQSELYFYERESGGDLSGAEIWAILGVWLCYQEPVRSNGRLMH